MSLTIFGLIATVALPLLVHLGFTESCANEITTIAPMIPGVILAWYGRVRQGDINILGAKK